MNLTDSRLKELENPALTHNERRLLRCRLASEFIHIGQYEVAREVLGDLWQGVGHRPDVEKLKPLTAAEVMLQCGVLSGWLGSIQHLSDYQEKAKDLIFEALRMFQAQGQHAKVSEAQYEISRCYFRLGAYDDARVFLDKALKGLGEDKNDLRAKIFIRQSIIEIWTSRYHDAWNVLERAREFFEACSAHSKANGTVREAWFYEGLPPQSIVLIMQTEQLSNIQPQSITMSWLDTKDIAATISTTSHSCFTS